jgi:serine beta-lactamase-like protein LACTB
MAMAGNLAHWWDCHPVKNLDRAHSNLYLILPIYLRRAPNQPEGFPMKLSRRTVLFGSATLAGMASASVPKVRLAAAREIVDSVLAGNPIPAFSIAVARRDTVIWREAFGTVDLELDVAATTAHRFRLGSVSKIITATLAARLAASGGVNLDAPISIYMPDLPAPHHATTLRQLLTHRGGLRHYTDKDYSLDAPGPIDHRQYRSTADVLAVFINDPLVARPGEQVLYSTFGYTLVSLVLEAATKTPFLDLVQQQIAAPLELPSLAGDSPDSIVSQRVSGYQPGDIIRRATPDFTGKWANAPQNNPAYKWAAGGLLATPADLARFGAAHLAPGKLSRETLHTLFTVYTQATERSPPLGLGWRIDTDNRGRMRWHHAGGQEGARAVLVIYPAQELAIAFATNVTGIPGDVLTPSSEIADALEMSAQAIRGR